MDYRIPTLSLIRLLISRHSRLNLINPHTCRRFSRHSRFSLISPHTCRRFSRCSPYSRQRPFRSLISNLFSSLSPRKPLTSLSSNISRFSNINLYSLSLPNNFSLNNRLTRLPKIKKRVTDLAGSRSFFRSRELLLDNMK